MIPKLAREGGCGSGLPGTGFLRAFFMGQLLTGQLLSEAAKTAVKTRSEDWEGLLNC